MKWSVGTMEWDVNRGIHLMEVHLMEVHLMEVNIGGAFNGGEYWKWILEVQWGEVMKR